MRTHEEMSKVFKRAKESGQEVQITSTPFCRIGGLLGTRYQLKWNSHVEEGFDTPESVDRACDRMCDVIEIEMSFAGMQ